MRNHFMRPSLKEKLKTLPKWSGEGEMTMLFAINCLVVLSEDSELSEEFLKAADVYIKRVAEGQNLSAMQVVLFAAIMEKDATGRNVDMGEVANFLRCNNVLLLQYQADIEELLKRGFICRCRNQEWETSRENRYIVPGEVIEALTKNQRFVPPSYKCEKDLELFQRFFGITHRHYRAEMSRDLMMFNIQRLLEENLSLPFVKRLKKLGLSLEDEIIVTHFCRHLVIDGEESLDMDNLATLYDDRTACSYFLSSLEDGEHQLITRGILEHNFEDGYASHESLRLTDKAIQKLLKGFKIHLHKEVNSGMIGHKDVVPKKLFFCDNVKKQLDGLSDLMADAQFKKICSRMKQKGLRQGFICLFYGAPGTGKTETVMQLARESGRDIFMVNISDVRSKWVGESEKNIKAIFNHYRSVAQCSKLKPILLFNEADAIIGKRREGAQRSVDKMENTIQNIILQEMETFEGIMIATTNLVRNMDSAFERRFLYKVKFEKPDVTVRQHIWKQMIPDLSDSSVADLARTYNFSGGQIENVVRKHTVNNILYGEVADPLPHLRSYCDKETLETVRRNKIGFK